MTTWPRILTIGAYGFDSETFFLRLREAEVAAFCDVRARRGVRGARYSFANSRRLQKALGEAGIRYVHCKELSPSDATRQAQYAEDQRAGRTKRAREVLGSTFVKSYESERLADFDSATFLRETFPQASSIVFFCVERVPRACHRSLITDRIAAELGVRVEHLLP